MPRRDLDSILRTHELMGRSQRIWAYKVATDKEWRKVLIEAEDLDLMITHNGETRYISRFIKKAKKCINYMGVSMILTGGARNIRTYGKPPKYAREIDEIEIAVARVLSAIDSRKRNNTYQNNLKQKIFEKLNLSEEQIEDYHNVDVLEGFNL